MATDLGVARAGKMGEVFGVSHLPDGCAVPEAAYGAKRNLSGRIFAQLYPLSVSRDIQEFQRCGRRREGYLSTGDRGDQPLDRCPDRKQHTNGPARTPCVQEIGFDHRAIDHPDGGAHQTALDSATVPLWLNVIENHFIQF